MKNYVQPGRNVTVTAPATLVSGEGVQIGALFGVAAGDADPGASVTLSTEGVFDLPKEATTTTFAVGDEVEWNAAQKRVDALSTGAKVGVVIAAASATDATARVRLTG